jgi:hypothetical protein
MEDLGNSREKVAFSGIGDVLSWRHALEAGQDPDYWRPGQPVVVYPKFLDKLDGIIASGKIGLDPVQSRWSAYDAILTQSITWPEGSRPFMLHEVDPRLSQWPVLAFRTEEWMKDAKGIADAGYRQVPEDGPDVCDSESDVEYS